MQIASRDRVNRFYAGQVWTSPKGTFYKVVSVQQGGEAILCSGINGTGRKVKRAWDAVNNWVLHFD